MLRFALEKLRHHCDTVNQIQFIFIAGYQDTFMSHVIPEKMHTHFLPLQRSFFGLAIFFTILTLWGCDKSPTLTPIGDAEIIVNQANQPAIVFDQIEAEVTTDAETSPFVQATLTASQSSGNASLTLILSDQDSLADPFIPGNDFTINTGTTSIFASLTFTDQGNTFTAISGRVNVSVYECLPEQTPGTLDQLRLSGSFSASDGNVEVSGTFMDIRVTCLECEGGC